jgi:multimeric flavodoxin WrbA
MAVKVAVVYHSGFGHTKVVAEHVAKGASSVAGVEAEVVNVDDLPAPGADRSLSGKWSVLNAADAIIFGSPTYMGDVSWQMKRFFEHASGLWFQQAWKDKIAAGFTNSGGASGDKLHALQSIQVNAGQHSMIWVSAGVMPSVYTKDGKDLNRLSSFSGLMTQAGNEAPEVTPPKQDKDTAEAFGARVAQATVRWVKGKG